MTPRRLLRPGRGRQLPRRILLPVLTVLAAAGLRAEYQVAIPTDRSGNVRIALTLPSDGWDGVGFMPVAVQIENNAATERAWQVEFQDNADGERTVRSTFKFRVPAHAAQETVVYLPGAGRSNFGEQLSASWQGPAVDPARQNILVPHGNVGEPIAASHRLATGIAGLWPVPSGGRGNQRTITDLDPARWPADWRVWSPFGVVALGADEYAALDSGRRAALRDWMALGGRLVLEPTGAGAGPGSTEPVGLGNLTIWDGNLQAIHDVRTTSQTYSQRTRISPPPAPGSGLPTFTTSVMTRSFPEPFETIPEFAPAAPRIAPWTGRYQLLAESDFGLWATERNPIALVVGLLVFALVVGPVNFFVFAPPGRRHRLFVTVPALSLLATLCLAATIVFGDGFGGRGVRPALVLLLPGQNRAAVFQEQISRTGVLLGAGFSLPADTAVCEPETGNGDRPRGGGPQLVRADTAVRGDWFRSRMTQTQQFWRITPTRARVELVGGGQDRAAPVVQSSVTTTLHDFVYVDAAGTAWKADLLPPGQRVTLQPDPQPWSASAVARMVCSPDPASSPDKIQAQLRQLKAKVQTLTRYHAAVPTDLTEQIERLSKLLALPLDQLPLPPDPRERGWFYALGGAGDLAPLATLSAIRWDDEDKVLYTGRLEAASTP